LHNSQKSITTGTITGWNALNDLLDTDRTITMFRQDVLERKTPLIFQYGGVEQTILVHGLRSRRIRQRLAEEKDWLEQKEL